MLLAVRVVMSAAAPDCAIWAMFGLYVVQASAQLYCEQSGGNLVTIDSASKTQFLVEQFLENSGLRFWRVIGLSLLGTGGDPANRSLYSWCRRARADTYSNWAPNEPNGDTKENPGSTLCVLAAGAGTWNDVSCNQATSTFICEF